MKEGSRRKQKKVMMSFNEKIREIVPTRLRVHGLKYVSIMFCIGSSARIFLTLYGSVCVSGG